MGTVLVTVAGPGGEVDLAVPDDVEVAAIVPALVPHCEPEPHPWSRWALGPPGGDPFPPRQTLGALGVVDGAELELRDMIGAQPGGRPSGREPDEDPRRLRLVDLAERLAADIARIRAGRNPLLEYAAPEARRQLRALAPGRLDRAAAGEDPAELALAVSWHEDPRAPVEAVATFTEAGAGPDRGVWPGQPSAAPPVRRVAVRMTVEAQCRQVLEVGVSAPSPG
jgi:hypothetical protein